MTKKAKIIVFDTYHIPSKEAKTLWADVYISFTTKPGRKKVSLGPCLICKKDVERSLEAEEKFGKDKEEIEALKALLAGNCIEIEEKPHADMPNIYYPGEWITRESAEILIAHWLKIRFGFQKIRAKWKRNRFSIGAA